MREDAATPVPLPADVAAFLDHLRVEKRVSAHTLDAYRRDLQALATWAQAQDLAPAAVDNPALRAFVAAEHRRGLSPKSLQRRLSACRSFFRWLLRHGRIEACLLYTSPSPRDRQKSRMPSSA